MEALPITIHRSRVLVTGFGSVGQCTAQRFRSLGAEVTVAARRPEQLTLAESMGCRPVSLASLSGTFDLVVNTVPAVILSGDVLSRLGRPILLELASPPGGFDTKAAAELGLTHIPAPNLPGKVAPVTAARAIQQTLYHMLQELDP
jgi:dipicolinate synthase subunit A